MTQDATTAAEATTRPRIVFGDDGSPHADRAWLWINSQRWPGWTVEIVTADYDPGDLWSDEVPVERTGWAPEAPRKAFAECGLGEVRHLRSTADARLVLEESDDARLIVVGSKGRFGVKSLLLGSTMEHLHNQPPGPLVIANSPQPAGRVLVCTDGSVNAQSAVASYATLPLATGATSTTILGVVDPGSENREEVGRGVEHAAATLADFNPEAIVAEAHESAARTILEHATARGAQLIVMGTRGRTGLKRALLGSTASSVARLAKATVLVVPPSGQPAAN